MWRNHSFSQRNKTMKRAVGMDFRRDGEGEGGLDKTWKRRSK